MIKKIGLLITIFLLFGFNSVFAAGGDVTFYTWDNNAPTETTYTVSGEEWEGIQILNDNYCGTEPNCIIKTITESESAVDIPKASMVAAQPDVPPSTAASVKNIVKSVNSKAAAPTKVPNGNCDYDPTSEGSIADALEKCVVENGTKLVNMSGSLILGGVDADASLKSALMGWIGKIAGFLGLGAMFAIAYGSMKLTLSGGEEDRIKKAKDIIKWGILGFLAIISASLLITIVVNIMYSF